MLYFVCKRSPLNKPTKYVNHIDPIYISTKLNNISYYNYFYQIVYLILKFLKLFLYQILIYLLFP